MKKRLQSCKPGVKDGDNNIKMSRYEFQNAKTLKDYLLLYSLFYLNEICINNYSDTFINPKGDNPLANEELGKKFKNITLMGIISFDSQLTIPGQQKGYISAYVPDDLAQKLAVDLNRYDNIIAFTTWITGEHCIREMYVTYDATKDIILQGAKQNKLLGDPETFIRSPDDRAYSFMQEWMSDEVKKQFNPETHVILNVIATSIHAPQHYVVDVLLKSAYKVTSHK